MLHKSKNLNGIMKTRRLILGIWFFSLTFGTITQSKAEKFIVNNFASLNAAFNSMSTGSDSIVIMSDIRLESDLQSFTYQKDSLVITAPTNADGTPQYTIDGNGFRFVHITSLKFCIVENLTVSNCSSNGAIRIGDPVTVTSSVNVLKVLNCISMNNTGHGIDIGFSRNTVVEINNCKAINNKASGFYLSGGPPSQLTITNCEAKGNTNNGFYISNTGKIRIENCTANDNSFGFQIYGTEGFLNNCNISANKTGILFNVNFGIINSCSISGSDNAGIDIKGTTTGGCIISNTTVFNNAKSWDSGILTENTHLKIINSTVSNNDGWGIVFSNRMLKPIEIYNSIIFGHSTRDLNADNIQKTFLYNSVYGRIYGSNFEAKNCITENPKMVWKNADGNITENVAEATHYFLADGSSAFDLADGSLITAEMLTTFVYTGEPLSDWLRNIITGELATNIVRYDQLGNLRQFNGVKYDAGSIARNAASGVDNWSYHPKKFADYGKGIITFYGDIFDDRVIITLKKQGENNITALKIESEHLETFNTYKCLATFNFHNISTGKYDIVIENGGETLTINNGLEIEERIEPDVYVELLGPVNIRNGAFTPFTIKYSNEGNVNAYWHPIIVEIIANLGVHVEVRERWEYIDIPGTFTDLYDEIDGVLHKLDTLHIGNNKYVTIVAPLIPVIPPYSTGYLTFDVRVIFEGSGLEPIEMSVYPLGSFFNYDDEPNEMGGISIKSLKSRSSGKTFWECFAECEPEIAQMVIGEVIPFTGCITQVADALEYIIFGAEGKNVNASWLAAKLLAGCGPDLIVGSGTAAKLVVKLLKVTGYLMDTTDLLQNLNDCMFPRNPVKPGSSRPRGGSYPSNAGGSFDPNDKIGPLNEFGSNAFRDRTEFTYIINFENDAKKASFPAQEVWIYDALDLNVFDINTFEAGIISIGSRVIDTPPDQQNFTWMVDMKPKMNLKTKVSLQLDKQTGLATWYFKTIDPATGELPVEATDGFLPPNDEDGSGQGFVMFTIKLKEGLPNDIVVANKAEIVFDFNEPIITDEWVNKKDIIPPSSAMLPPVKKSDDLIELTWQGTDNQGGSGIYGYDVYAKQGDSDYELIFSKTSETTSLFTVEKDVLYSFYTIATDKAGNRETKTKIPDVVFSLQPITGTNELADQPQIATLIPNPAYTECTVAFDVEKAGYITVTLSNMSGIRLMNIYAGNAESGSFRHTFNIGSLPTGVYIVTIHSGNSLVGAARLVKIP